MELLTFNFFLLFFHTSKMTETRTPDYRLHFSCRISNKTDAITFTFYAEELFLSVKTQLLNQYNSNLNKNENGLETFILERIKRPYTALKRSLYKGKGAEIGN